MQRMGSIVSFGGRLPHIAREICYDSLPNDPETKDGTPLGALALRQIRRHQRCWDVCLPRRTFWEISRSVLAEIGPSAKKMEFSLDALEALQQAMEVVLIERFESGVVRSIARSPVSESKFPGIVLGVEDLAPITIANVT